MSEKKKVKKEEKDELYEDVVFEEEENASGFSPASTKKLRERLKKAVEEKQEYLDGWQRAKADLVNLRKSFEEERGAIKNRAEANLITELLPVFDSFEMAFKNKDAWEAVDTNWRVGVEYIHQQLHSIMKEYGVSRINTDGQIFDPRFHVSVEMIPTNEKEKDGTIEKTVHYGYMKGEMVLRPAQVVVYDYKQEN